MPHEDYEAAITLRDVHEDIRAMRTELTTVITQLSTATANQLDHETRIRALERRVWTAAGVAAAIAAVIPQLGPIAAAFGG
ncbi:hypothetical protein SAMN02982929_07237 [Saccharopolyspora kobensis]|uniref:DUF7201 domain-containing protein n=1 Tax=Saccharopolyspora kobensis TaxID=146035 RepID=A0A1H6EPK6_9PSEU|nr:hypothetical protein [Saccharopolyspora kobensis]SEG98865.1 hypothetical protein SAMN02982929_07237 [Saccharopolyspora kobensis]SFD23311.1 hypothetical protein SAMN05216506_103162 [Saccharopolyspora kobensis]